MSTQILSVPAQATPSLTYQQLDSVHSLRGFCALYVVIYHAKYILWSGGSEFIQAFPQTAWKLSDYINFGLAMASSAGYEMVIFFFVLSGFFIRYATVRKPRPILRFYLNRAVRIYPPYLASLVLAALVLAALAIWRPNLLSLVPHRELNTGLLNAWYELRHQSIPVTLKSLLFMSTNGQFFGYNNVYWSLLPETIFYLLVPLVLRYARTYYVFSVVVFAVGQALVLRHINAPIIFDYLIIYNAYFALGCWLHDIIAKRPEISINLGQANGFLLVFILAGLFGTIIVLAALHISVLAVPLAGLLAVLSVMLLLSGRISGQTPLIKIFHTIGLFSFSLYLYHFPLLIACYALLTYFTGTVFSYGYWFWLFVPVVTLGSYALYWITERPAVQYFRGL